MFKVIVFKVDGVGGVQQARGTSQLPKWPGPTGGERPAPAGSGWWAQAPGAEVVAGAQLLVGAALWMFWPSSSDNYDRDGWGPFGLLVFLVFLGVVCLFVVPCLAFLHSLVFTRPAMALARKTGNPGAAPAWLLAASAACAVVPWVLGVPYADSLAWIAAGGPAPLLLAWWASRRGWRPWPVASVTAGVTALVLLPGALVGGFLLAEAGLLKGYESPRLERAAYVGEWAGDDGGTVRIHEDGRVEVEGVLGYGDDDTAARCTGAGTWTERPADHGMRMRAGVDLDVTGCVRWQSQWEVSGTAAHPELFQLVGDPDAGDVRLLRRW